MRKRKKAIGLMLAAACLFGLRLGAAEEKEAREGKDSRQAATEEVQAKDLLMDMAKVLSEAKAFSVTIRMSYDAVQETGEKITFREERDVLLQRPNHLRVDAIQGDGDEHFLIFDGKAITIYSYDDNVYSQIEHPGNVDEAVRYAGGTMGIRIPLARMLVSTLAEELEALKPDVDYVEEDMLDEEPADHLIARLKDVDFQVWLSVDDKLPVHVVITYKNAPGQPQFRADFKGWNLDPDIEKDAFVFTPPEGAEKVPSLLPEKVVLQKEKVEKKPAARESEKKKAKAAAPAGDKATKAKGGDK